jgi:hypothetical protein
MKVNEEKTDKKKKLAGRTILNISLVDEVYVLAKMQANIEKRPLSKLISELLEDYLKGKISIKVKDMTGGITASEVSITSKRDS